MNKVTLKSITLKNFKGIRNAEFDFNDLITEFKGANETFKTSLADAFFYVLFHKDSYGRSDFIVRTINKKTKTLIPNLEHFVTLKLDVNGTEITFEKLLKEEYSKKQGTAEKVYKGHKTTYLFEGGKIKKSDYDAKVSKYINESLFKILSNPMYFNSLPWKEQRNHLLELEPELSNEEFAKRNNYTALLNKVGKEKSISEYISAKKYKLDGLEKRNQQIPTRIDENESKIDHELEDADYYEGEISKANEAIKELESNLNGFCLHDNPETVKQINERINQKNQKRQTILSENFNLINISINEKQIEVNKLDKEKRDLETQKNRKDDELKEISDVEIPGLTKSLKSKEKEIEDLRDEYRIENNKSFTPFESGETCSHCGQQLDAEHLKDINEQAKNEFDKNKANKLKEIKQSGIELNTSKQNINSNLENKREKKISLSNEIAKLLEQIDVITPKLEKLQSELLSLEQSNKPDQMPDIQKIDKEIKGLNDEKTFLENPDANKQEQKNKIESELQAWQNQLNDNQQLLNKVQSNSEVHKRIEELDKEQKDLVKQIEYLYKDLNEIEEFERAKTFDLQNRINSKFEFVDFKLFIDQKNGAFKETCIATVDGVPYPQVNTAGKINAGIDIINVFSKFYGQSGPIIIDNKESVTKLLPTENQIISLKVDENYKELTKTN